MLLGRATASVILDAHLRCIYVVSVGHNNRRIIDAIKHQLDVLAFSPPMHGTNPPAVQLANLLADLAPGDLSTVKFQCGGAEVVEAAIKLARQYHKLTGSPGKYKIISRYQSWHGSTLGGAIGLQGIEVRRTDRQRAGWHQASFTSSRQLATAVRSARRIPPARSRALEP